MYAPKDRQILEGTQHPVRMALIVGIAFCSLASVVVCHFDMSRSLTPNHRLRSKFEAEPLSLLALSKGKLSKARDFLEAAATSRVSREDKMKLKEELDILRKEEAYHAKFKNTQINEEKLIRNEESKLREQEDAFRKGDINLAKDLAREVHHITEQQEHMGSMAHKLDAREHETEAKAVKAMARWQPKATDAMSNLLKAQHEDILSTETRVLHNVADIEERQVQLERRQEKIRRKQDELDALERLDRQTSDSKPQDMSIVGL